MIRTLPKRSDGAQALVVRLTFLALAVSAFGFARASERAAPTTHSGLRLRWENVEGPPFLVGGKSLKYWLGRGEHVASLGRGESVKIWLPSGALLRIRRPSGKLETRHVEIWFSDGSGVQLRGRPVPTNDQSSILFDPQTPGASIVEVGCAEGAEPLDLAFYISKFDFGDCDTLCRDFVRFPAERVVIVKPGARFLPGSRELYWRAEDGDSGSAVILGPAHCRIESRLLFPEGEAETLQGYTLRVFVDGEVATVRHETSLDERGAYAVGSERRWLSRGRRYCFDLPPGRHELRVESGPDVCWRVLVGSPRSFLIGCGPWLVESVPAPQGFGLGAKLGNAYLDLGLSKAYWAREGLRDYASPPWVQAERRATFRRNARYRSLLPQDFRPGEPQLVARFAILALEDPLERGTDVHLRPEDVAPRSRGLSKGFFLRAPHGKDGAYVFPLPARYSPSFLRIVVARPSPFAAHLMVEVGEGDVRVARVAPGPELPRRFFRPSDAEAAAAAIAAKLRELLGSDAPESAFEPSDSDLPVFEVGAAELELREAAERVRLWAEGDGIPPLVAVQVLSEAPYELTEREFREAGGASAAGTLLGEFARWYEDREAPDASGGDLLAHRLPLFRFLGQQLDQLAARAIEVAPRDDRPEETAGRETAEDGVLAEDFEKRGEWLLALEAWSSLLRGGAAEDRARARFGLIRALENLGEEFLAELQLLGAWRTDPDATVRERAFRELVSFYGRRGEEDSLLRVFVRAALDSRDPQYVCELASRLLAKGQHSMALSLLLDVPESSRPLELWLRAARKLGWWRSFEEALSRLPSAVDRSYWEGVRLVSERSYPAALKALEAGGERGAALASRIERAVQIVKCLYDPDPATRASAILEWEAWHASGGEPREWAEAPSVVLYASGAVICRSVPRNVYELYYRSEPAKPLRLRILGPRRLRLSLRPVHEAREDRRLDTWVLVRGKGLLLPVCISWNRKSSGLEIVGRPEKVPGFEVTRELPLGPGLRELEIAPRDGEVLVKWELDEPELDIGILPAFTHSNLLRLLRPRERPSSPRAEYMELPADLDPLLAARLALRVGIPTLISGRREGLARLASGETQISDEERALAAAWLEELDRPDELERAFEAAERVGPRAALERILFAAENDPALASRAMVVGERLLRAYAGAPGLQPLGRRLLSRASWQRITLVRDSAGLRHTASASFQPELPELRVRTALMAPPRPGETPIVGAGTERFVFRNPAALRVELGFRLEPVEFAPRVPTTVLVRLDGEAVRRLELSADRPADRIEITVPEGEHALAVSVEDPEANQYVWVSCSRAQLSEARDEEEEAVGGARRRYDIATRDRPVLLDVEGPVWLRIDELRDGRTWTRYLEVPPGTQEIRLEPAPGRSEGLYRIFRREHLASRESPEVPVYRPRIRAVPPPPWEANAAPRPEGFVTEDPLPLGGQEDGTFALEFSANRRAVFEEVRRSEEYDAYAELKGSHLLWSFSGSLHSATAILARVHEDAGPSIGFEEELTWRPDWLPATLRFLGTAYAQWPRGSSLEPGGSMEWALTLRGSVSKIFRLGSKSHQVTSLSVFGRLLSLDDASSYGGAVIDPDVFSEYKSDHRNGAVLSGTFVYRPWLDVEWWSRLSVTSNQDVHSPVVDHVSGWIGWRQYLFGAVADVGYRAGLFLEDEDRKSTSLRHAAFARLAYDFWASARDRIEISVEYRHDFPVHRDVGVFSIAWYFSNGRLYKDCRPGTVDFEDLRTLRAPPAHSPRVVELYGE